MKKRVLLRIQRIEMQHVAEGISKFVLYSSIQASKRLLFYCDLVQKSG
jgi:hypothetical protein